jgi:Flp pilus assembly CpaF family ATPase
MNSATFCAADPATTNTSQPPADAITSFTMPELQLRSAGRVISLFQPARCVVNGARRDRTEIRSEQLLEASLRMRPDRVLMGELRDGAAWTYLRGVIAGHPGGITTLHANSAEGAFNALRLMMRQHPEGKTMPDDVIEGMLREQIDIVCHLSRSPTTKRINVTDVYEKAA